MVTLKLKKTPSTPAPEATRQRQPVRASSGSARPRPTRAQAQAERARREQEWAAASGDRGDRPRDDRPLGDRPPRRDDRPRDDRPPRHDARGDTPHRDSSPRDDRPWHPGSDFGSPRTRRPEPSGTPAPRPRRVLEPARPVQSGGSGRPNPPVPVAPREPAVTAHEGERLSKRMTALGLASRREADEWIEAGWVRVEGKMAVLGQRVRPDVQITIDPAAHKQQAQRVTVLINKPVGHVSGQAEDGYPPAAALIRPENQWAEDKSGIHWHPGHLRGLAPAGRLDIDSVGLLVLTQDGRVAKQLVGDESLVEKEYLVRVAYQGQGGLPDSALALLNHGLELDDQPLRPAKVSWANEDQLRFVLREGKKRQIRRMCEAVGLQVLGLKRVRIGSVALGHLPVGQWRYLRRDEFFI